MKKPSEYLKAMPLASVLGRAEEESVAYAIIRLLSETGNEWREVTFKEYRDRYLNRTMSKLQKEVKWYHSVATKKEIREDIKQGIDDYGYNCELFTSVKKYCVSEGQAKKFSPAWKDIDGHVEEYGDRLEFIKQQQS